MNHLSRKTQFAIFLTGVLLVCTQLQADVPATTAVKAADFLDSIGACVHVQHHQDATKLVEPIRYTGIRAIRDGADGNFDMTGLLLLHQQAGVMVCFGPGSGAKEDSLEKTLAACRKLAAAGALLAIEGPNEPNNFGGVTYEGKNSSKLKSWLPVAHYQRDLYAAVKSDPELKNFPVYGVSEAGAEDDNAGLQFLTIPENAKTLMPAGTRFCDFLNCHNYVCGTNNRIGENQATLAASVRPKSPIDHLFGNHGKTWRKKFDGYTEQQLETLPKVTTETGWRSDKTPAGDDLQGKLLINVFLAQYKAGWAHTFIYEFTDDADGAFGFYKADLVTPRKAAVYLHNFTAILSDHAPKGSPARETPGTLVFSIPDQPASVHELLLQNSDGKFDLIVWGERIKGGDDVTVNFAIPHRAIEVYDPTIGVKPTQSLVQSKAVSLNVSDHAIILGVSD